MFLTRLRIKTATHLVKTPFSGLTFPPLSQALIARITSLNNRNMSSSAAAKRLQGKTIVVTGASSGIGRSTAFEFARTAPKNNLKLILTARRIDTLKEVAAKIGEEVGDGVQVLPVQLDVSDAAQVKSFVGNLPEGWRDINVLVNNA